MVLGFGMHSSITSRAGVMFLTDRLIDQEDGLKKSEYKWIKESRCLGETTQKESKK